MHSNNDGTQKTMQSLVQHSLFAYYSAAKNDNYSEHVHSVSNIFDNCMKNSLKMPARCQV